MTTADCDRSLELHPGYTKALFRRWFCMGSAAFMMGEFNTSVSHFGAALDLDPTNVIVKQELHKAKTAVEVIKAKERTKEIEKEMAAREILRADEREREKKALEEKKTRDEMIRKEKAEKAEMERLERLRLKEEKAKLQKEKGKEMEEEEEKKKEEKRLEKEKERLAREQEKAEERERKRVEREREKQRAKEEKVIRPFVIGSLANPLKIRFHIPSNPSPSLVYTTHPITYSCSTLTNTTTCIIVTSPFSHSLTTISFPHP